MFAQKIKAHVGFQGLIQASEYKMNANYLKLTAMSSGACAVCLSKLISRNQTVAMLEGEKTPESNMSQNQYQSLSEDILLK